MIDFNAAISTFNSCHCWDSLNLFYSLLVVSVELLLVLVVFSAVWQLSNIISGIRDTQFLPFDDFFISRLKSTKAIIRSSISLLSFSMEMLRKLAMVVKSVLA